MSEADQGKLFCPLHGDYSPSKHGARCPRCAEDPIASQASLRAVKVITTAEMPPGIADAADEPTSIDDVAPCPSCHQIVGLDQFQSEAVGEVWEGEAALWAEEGVCATCYRDLIPGLSSEWSTDEWLTHHFEGWHSQVRRVHEIVEHGTSEQDAWLPEEQRHRILDVEKTLAARREHLARAQMRLREFKADLGVDELPERFALSLQSARRALDERSIERLKSRHEEDMQVEAERRVESVLEMSPRHALEEAGLDAPGLLDAPPPLPEPTPVAPGEAPAAQDTSRWPLAAVAAAVLGFAAWWFLTR